MLNCLQRLILILDLTYAYGLLLHLQVPCRNLYYPLLLQGIVSIADPTQGVNRFSKIFVLFQLRC